MPLLPLVQERVIHLRFLFYVIEQFQIHYNVFYDDFQIVSDVLNKILFCSIQKKNQIPSASGEIIAFSSIDLRDT